MSANVGGSPSRIGGGPAPRGARVAVSLAPRSHDEAESLMSRIGPHVSWVELRLDALAERDPAALVRRSPVGVIATCRPVREGGAFDGSERERLDILAAAAAAGARYVDLEWDVPKAPRLGHAGCRLIRSRHFASMPGTLMPWYQELRLHGDVVKLAAPARDLLDIAPVVQCLAAATSPIIAIAMGEVGRLTRVLALSYEHTFCTYAALESGRETAPGQWTVEEMVSRFAVHRLGPQSRVHVQVSASRARADAWERLGSSRGRRKVHVGVVAQPQEAACTAAFLSALDPRWTVHTDPELLGAPLPPPAHVVRRQDPPRAPGAEGAGAPGPSEGASP